MNNAIALITCLLASVLGLVGGPTLADSRAYTVSNVTYRTECGSCHIAYPPQLLNVQAWRSIMAQLDRHFGSDASLDAKAADEIRAYLAADAGRKNASAPASTTLPRITKSAWFVREHDEVAKPVWERDAIKSPANCGACHTQAEKADFSERTLRVPR